MVTLKRLRIHQLRNVRPGSEITFDDEWNVVLGRNGTGKTTLLALVVAVLGSRLTEYEREPYHLEYELVLGDVHLTGEVKNVLERPDATPWGGRTPSGMIATLRTHFRAPAGERGGLVTVGGADSTRPRSGEDEPTSLSAATVDIFDPALRQGALRAARDLAGYLERFDEALLYFDQLTGGRGSRPHGFEVMRHGGRISNAAVPWKYLREITALLDDAHLVGDSCDLTFEELPFLRKATAALGYASAKLSFELLRRTVVGDVERSEYGPMRFRFYGEGGSATRDDALSQGQKRLLALYYYLAANKEVVVADELANGLHREWLELAIHEMAGRQKFLTSQNPVLLDYLSFDTVDDVRRRLVQCKLEGGEMVWGNIPLEDAEGVLRSYRAGTKHVGEILRAQGME